MAIAAVPYDLKVWYGGTEYPVHIDAMSVPKCTNCGAISIDAETERQIDLAFREAATLLPKEAIRANRKQLGLTQQEMARRLRISKEMLSRWETGTRIQQRHMDMLLRVFFASADVRRTLADDSRLPTIGLAITECAIPDLNEGVLI